MAATTSLWRQYSGLDQVEEPKESKALQPQEALQPVTGFEVAEGDDAQHEAVNESDNEEVHSDEEEQGDGEDP
jgi:hypothetical protein